MERKQLLEEQERVAKCHDCHLLNFSFARCYMILILLHGQVF